MARIPAVVLGLNPNALGTIRALAARRIPVIAADQRPAGWADTHRWMSSRTRLCQKLFYSASATGDALLDLLVELGPTLPGPAPVLPSGDAELLLLARHEALLKRWYRFHVPPPEHLRLFVEKRGFHEFARNAGVPIPATIAPLTNDRIDEAARTMRFPCVLKPEFRDHQWDDLFAPRKGLGVESAAALRDAFTEATRSGTSLMLQESIPGADSELHFTHGYFDRDGNPVAMWTGRKIRQLPIHYGTTTLAETVPIAAIVDHTLRLMQPLGHRGYVSVEFKRDPRDGAFRVLEATVGRTWYPHYLGVVAGVNIPELWYHDLLDIARPAQPAPSVPGPFPRSEVRYGVRWVDEYRDLVAAMEYRRAGELTIRGWIASLFGIRGAALAAWRDPMPFLYMVFRLGISVRNAVMRRAQFIRGRPPRADH